MRKLYKNPRIVLWKDLEEQDKIPEKVDSRYFEKLMERIKNAPEVKKDSDTPELDSFV
jgi:hypothetical protein